MTAPSTGIAPSVAGAAATRASDGRPARLLAWLGIGGALTAVVLVGALHMLPATAGIDPVRRTISEYALSGAGWVFNVGVLALAIGSLAIAAGLVLAGLARAGSIGSALVVVWSAALLVIVAFPKHNWAVGPSTNGQIHRAASIVAFLALPVAVLLLTRRTRRTHKIRRARRSAGAARQPEPVPARVACWLGVMSLAWFVPILGAILLAPWTRTPWWQAIPLGLVERGLVISEVLAVIVLGVFVLGATSLRATSRRTTHPGASSLSARKQPRSPLPASQAPTGPTA